MRARLGFAAADLPWTDVLLLDEVHEALDHEYREVVEARAQEIVAAGGVVVAAGHDHPLLDRICTRALWIDGGRIVADGPFQELQERYLAHAHPDGAGSPPP
jgi:ABC-type polysaccharide/polyol phosphate transport system ATPase subunit